MTIAEAGKEYGFTPDTLRYYEKMGLIKPERTSGGIRDYSEDDLKRLGFIHCMRQAGVSIKALTQYLSLFNEDRDTSKERKAILLEQQALLIRKKEAIEKTLSLLDYKISHYDEIMANKGGCQHEKANGGTGRSR